MKPITPLRYPGGKACLAPALSELIDANGIVRPVVVEPYAGGAGASLALLFSEQAERILINDFDYRIYSFWWAILNRLDEFVERISSIPLSIRIWKEQREIYRNARRYSRFDVGFAAFYLNRTNRSGILFNGGPIGGFKQRGEWGLGARFSRPNLVDRIRRIHTYRDRITISNEDALHFLERTKQALNKNAFFTYLDPPYYHKGSTLYLSSYTHQDHLAIATMLQNWNDLCWVATYDDVVAIRRMYSSCKQIRFRLRYTAHRRRSGAELLIVPKRIKTPPRLLRAVIR